MSVLSFPRIYLRGYTSWDPCTFNNNDFAKFPTYNAALATLNWPFLAIQDPPVTPENFVNTFRPYAIKLQGDSIDSPAGPRVPCEWNMFGSHAVAFVQYQDYTTTITGGALEYNQPATNDPVIGTTLSILGDTQYSAPKLVDTNPSSFWSSQIYYGSLQVGSGNYSMSGPRVERMHSRWVNLARIYAADRQLTQPAASVGCCFQACIRNKGIVWKNGASGEPVSPLLAALQKASSASGAQGVMVRFTAGPVNALAERQYCAQTDSRGIYLDQRTEHIFQISVLKQGMRAADVKVLLARYDQNLNLVPSAPPSYIRFTLGEQQVVNSQSPPGGSQTASVVSVVTADSNGIARAGVAAVSPGFPVIAFFPFTGDTLPAPPPSLFPPGNTFFTTVRVLPFDDALPQEFADLWNQTHDQMQA